MEDNAKLIESLLERATEFGKTSYEIVKLKTIDKTSDFVSSLIPHSVVIIILTTFILFLNFGLAFWIGEIMGKVFYGFFIVAAFYALTALIIHFFMHKCLKKLIYNYIIKKLLN